MKYQTLRPTFSPWVGGVGGWGGWCAGKEWGKWWGGCGGDGVVC